MKANIVDLVVSAHHPLAVGLACVACMIIFFAGVVYEARRRHVQRRKYKHTCPYCRAGEVSRRHIRVKLSPDLTGNWLTKLLSRMDYLCQTQATCLNKACPRDQKPYAERTDLKQWGFRSRVTRLKQLRHTVPADQLIWNSYVGEVLKERGMPVKDSREKAIQRPAPRQPFDLKKPQLVVVLRKS